MAVNPINRIAPKVEVSFVPLWYGSYGLGGRLAVHEKVRLCDTVTVRYEPFGIERKAKVVRTKYDVLDEKFNEIAVGMWRTSFTEAYAAMSDQTEATLTAVSRYPSRWKKDIENTAAEHVQKSGDTMTGDLENTSVSNRRTIMQGNRFYAENANNTAQNAALYYNGVATTNGTNTSTLTPTGLDLDGTTLTSAIGTQLRNNGTASVPNNTWTATGSFTLAKGTWVIVAYTQFPNNTTGVRGMNLHQTSGSSSGQTSEYADCGNAVGGTFVSRLRVVVTRAVGANTTFYINAYQNSGSSQTVTWVYSCVRIL